MSKGILRSVLSYTGYLIRSRTKHSVHSPFVYDLITKVLDNKDRVHDFSGINSLRRELCQSSRVLETTDFGISANQNHYRTRFLTVKQIARVSSVNRKTGEILYRLVNYFKPQNILELGTSFGISTMYMATGNPSSRVITMEGCAAKVDLAKSNFGRLGVTNVEVSTGRFDTRLPVVLEKMPELDFIFMDGHHMYKPTLAYFRMLLTHLSENSVVVMDDIHWSPGMEKVWKEISSLPDVTVSIDIYRAGLLFFRKGMSKQHFIIRY